MEPPLAEVIRAIEPHLALVIHEADFEDRVHLMLSGPGWSLNVNAPWRISRAGRLLLGSEDATAASVGGLITQRIVAVVPQGIGGLDPAFVLDGDKVLEVFSCYPTEPWVLRLPSGPVWVASPSAPGAG